MSSNVYVLQFRTLQHPWQLALHSQLFCFLHTQLNVVSYCYRVTKASFTCAVIYSLNELKVLHFVREDLCLWVAILLVSLKVYSILIAEVDPFTLPALTIWSIITCVSPSRELQNSSQSNPTNQKPKTSWKPQQRWN